MKVGSYRSKNRLTFKRSVMDQIDEDGIYVNEIESLGVFEIPKKDFYKYFDNVVASRSWDDGIYGYKNFPSWANRYLKPNKKESANYTSITTQKIVQKKIIEKNETDFVGNEIRTKIREIGKLWYNSPNKIKLSENSINHWYNIIKEWTNDKTLPLVVRKETKRRGEAITHPSGREIILADNSFATWVICNVINNKLYSLDEIRNKLLKDEIPFMFISTKKLKEKAKYKTALGDNETIGWTLCHKEAIGFNKKDKIEDINIEIIKDHFFKYANPKNMFLLPREIGFLGELKEFIEEQKD